MNLSGRSGTGTTSVGAGSRDVTNLTTVVALFSQILVLELKVLVGLQFGQPPGGTLGRCDPPVHSSKLISTSSTRSSYGRWELT